MRSFWWFPFGRVPEIHAHDLHAMLQGDSPPQLVDVRTAMEWRTSRIAGAVNAPVTERRAWLESLALDRNRKVVAICLTAHRSIPAVRILRASGFDACQLHNGMLAWWHAHLPVEAGHPDEG